LKLQKLTLLDYKNKKKMDDIRIKNSKRTKQKQNCE
jgi:hypothetical protein